MLPLKHIFTVSLLLLFAWVRAQISFIPNQNQWAEQVLFQADIQDGRAFFGEDKITFSYYNTNDLENAHGVHLDTNAADPCALRDDRIRCYAYEMKFVNAQEPVVNGRDPKRHHVNYFIGNDPTKWASNVPVYESIRYHEIYPGIDIAYYGSGQQMKYDYIVSPQSDAAQIVVQYNGQRSIHLENGKLLLDLDFISLTEMIPTAYQLRNGVKEMVDCRFALSGNEVKFVFPRGYDKSLELIIDPVIIGSTYSGSIGVGAGFCATFDEEGNIYSGGNAWSPGFPVSLSSYDASYHGGGDLAICKYSPDASTLLYCTYIGGMGADFPQSMMVSNGNLYIYGATYSWDFPFTAQAFDQNLNGICDIYICCLNSTGSSLLASTYVGGNYGDGTNVIQVYFPDLLRGELRIAKNGDVLVASSCISTTFPTTPGAYRTSSTGSQDAVVFRMDATLSTMIWATYLGSGAHDVAMGLREADDGSIYVCGCTANMFTLFPTVSGCYETTPLLGPDAFVVKLSGNGSSLLASTYYGGSSFDMAYYVDTDNDGDVYIFGITRGNVPITPNVLSIPGGQYFVAKLSADLTELMYSTVIGGTGAAISLGGPITPGPPQVGGPAPEPGTTPGGPFAFMVDKCERVYIAAFSMNTNWPPPTIPFYPYSAKHQLCVAVLEEDATELLASAVHPGWHSDGGGGRFDKIGILYQSVCQDESEFPTVPWAYADGSLAGDWDMCVVKIDMEIREPKPEEFVLPNVFTPNGDGINDEYVCGLYFPREFTLRVYNRWGTEVFYSDDIDVRWDGTTTSGQPCEEGVYFIDLRFRYCADELRKNAFVHLLR